MFPYSLLSTVYAVEKFELVAKPTTIVLLVAALLVGVVVFFRKRNVFRKYVTISLFCGAGYLLLLGVLFFALDLAKHYSDSYATENWLDKRLLTTYILLPMLTLCCVCFLALALYAAISRFAPDRKKTVAIVETIVCVLALGVTLVCLAVYYDKKIADDGYYNSDTATVKQTALYALAACSAFLIFALSLFDKQKFRLDSRAIAYAGVCASMSYALSYIKLWDMPSGGAVTLVSLLPLMLYAYVFGAKKGVFVGFAYGLLQALQDPWLIHPAQFLLDYPIAFSAVGLAGLFRNVQGLRKAPQAQFALGASVAGSVRFLCHVLSGVFAFSVNAEGQNVWLYSLGYNAYVFIDAALVVVAAVLVLSSPSFLKAVRKARK